MDEFDSNPCAIPWGPTCPISSLPRDGHCFVQIAPPRPHQARRPPSHDSLNTYFFQVNRANNVGRLTSTFEAKACSILRAHSHTHTLLTKSRVQKAFDATRYETCTRRARRTRVNRRDGTLCLDRRRVSRPPSPRLTVTLTRQLFPSTDAAMLIRHIRRQMA